MINTILSVFTYFVENTQNTHSHTPTRKQGVAEILSAPSTPNLRFIGWGRETDLAVPLLTRTLLAWMDATRPAGKEGPSSPDSSGFFSMSEHPSVHVVLSSGTTTPNSKHKPKRWAAAGGYSTVHHDLITLTESLRQLFIIGRAQLASEFPLVI